MDTDAAGLTKAQRQVLQLVFDEHHEHGTWPRFGTLRRRLARSKQPDLAHVVRDLPDGLLQTLWSGNVRPEDDADMRLTARGMALCVGSENDIELFLRALRWMAKRELAFDPDRSDSGQECTVSGRQLMRAFHLPASRRPDVDRLGHLLRVESWGQQSAATNSWNWTFALGPEVQRFARVHSIDDYLATRQAWTDENTPPPPVASQPYGDLDAAPPTESPRAYVAETLIDDLKRAAANQGLSGDKLAALLGELNDNYARGNAYACHSLLRAVLDHLPPLLGQTSFTAVVSNVSWGRTDQKYLKRLVDFRAQADDALHRQISTANHHLDIDDLPSAVCLRRLLAQCATTTVATSKA